MSIKKGSRTIASSVPVTEWGSVDGTLSDQADLKSALESKAPTYSPTFTGTPIAPTAPIDVSNNQIATTRYVQEALLNAEANLPEQSGNAGKFLTTNGQIPSWANVDALPSQANQGGKFLKTNGLTASWAEPVTLDTTQTITATKTFTTRPAIQTSSTEGRIVTKFTDIEIGVNPSETHFAGFLSTDKNGKQFANCNCSYTNEGRIGCNFYVERNISGSTVNGILGIYVLPSGAVYTSAPTPTDTTTTSGTQIATTGWVNSTNNNVVHKSGNETIAGTKTFSSPIKGSLDGGFVYYYCHNGETGGLYYKMGEAILTGIYNTKQIQFFLQNGAAADDRQGLGFGEICARVEGTAGIFNPSASKIVFDSGCPTWIKANLDNFRLYYWNNYDTDKVKVELWFYVQYAYDGRSLSIMDNISAGQSRQSAWTFYNGSATTSYPTDATGYITASILGGHTNTPESSSNDTKIPNTSWVNTKISDVTLTNGTNISIDNKAINYTGPRYYRLATRTWTYAQWTQYCERGVTTNISPSFTVTGIRTGDLVTVEGICSDRNNANVLAWGIANGEPAAETNNVSVTFLGLCIQDSFYVPNPIQVVTSLPSSPDANTIYIVTG